MTIIYAPLGAPVADFREFVIAQPAFDIGARPIERGGRFGGGAAGSRLCQSLLCGDCECAAQSRLIHLGRAIDGCAKCLAEDVHDGLVFDLLIGLGSHDPLGFDENVGPVGDLLGGGFLQGSLFFICLFGLCRRLVCLLALGGNDFADGLGDAGGQPLLVQRGLLIATLAIILGVRPL